MIVGRHREREKRARDPVTIDTRDCDSPSQPGLPRFRNSGNMEMTLPLSSAVGRCLLLDQKSDLPFFLFRWRHQLTNGVENRLDLVVVGADSTF